MFCLFGTFLEKLNHRAYSLVYSGEIRFIEKITSWTRNRCFFEYFDSVADPGCLSLIPDSDLDYYPSQIRDLGSRIQKKQQKRGMKKVCCHTFFCSHKFHKLQIIYFFTAEGNILDNFQKIIELFTQKIVPI